MATSLGAVSMSASTDHTVSIGSVTAGKTLFVAVTASATLVLHSAAVTAGWVQDVYVVNSVGFGVYRLPGVSNPGSTVASLRLTHNGSAWLGGLAWEDSTSGSPTFSASNADSGSQVIQSPLTTGAQTFSSQAIAYTIFSTLQTGTNNTSDITAFDQGFTEIGDSGYLSSGASENIRMWVAGATSKALTSTAVTGTWSDAGIFGYNNSAVLGFAAGSPPASGWSTSLAFG